MLLINLIAARRAERRKLELIRGGTVRAMVGVVATTGVVALFTTMSMNQTNLRIRDVDAQTVLLQETVDRVEALKSDIARLQPRVNVLVRAQNSTDRWRGVLQAVSASLPDKTWVTSFQSKQTTKDKAEGFLMTGQTVTHDRIGRAMLKIDKSPFVQSVDLNYAAQRQEGAGVAFELGGELKPVEGASDAS